MIEKSLTSFSDVRDRLDRSAKNLKMVMSTSIVRTILEQRLPKEYPTKEEMNALVVNDFAEKLGFYKPEMFGFEPSDEEKYEDVLKIMRNSLTIILQQNPEVYPKDERYENLVQFLGYENEETFVNALEEKIITTAKVFNIHENEVKYMFDFAKSAYSMSSTPMRKSGEAYYCHALRTVWYSLSAILNSSQRPTSEQIYSMIVCGLNHDVLEDVQPEEGKTQYKASIEENLLVIRQADGMVVQFIELTEKQSITLQALTKTDESKQRAIQNIIDQDKSGIAAWIKIGDAIDNNLTMFVTDNWLKLISDLREKQTGMTKVAAMAHFDVDDNWMPIRLIRRLLNNDMTIFSASLMAETQINRAFMQIRRQLISYIRDNYQSNHSSNKLETYLLQWCDMQEMSINQKDEREYLEIFSLDRLLDTYTLRKALERNEEKKEEPFNFGDILFFIREALQRKLDRVRVI